MYDELYIHKDKHLPRKVFVEYDREKKLFHAYVRIGLFAKMHTYARSRKTAVNVLTKRCWTQGWNIK